MAVTVTTNRPIDLAQLDAELGGVGLNMTVTADGTTVCAVGAGTSQATLQAAVDAHIPHEPPPSTDSMLQSQIDELTDLILELI
jgi:hypothetical protein